MQRKGSEVKGESGHASHMELSLGIVDTSNICGQVVVRT